MIQSFMNWPKGIANWHKIKTTGTKKPAGKK
jgi:hypothetical protein